MIYNDQKIDYPPSFFEYGFKISENEQIRDGFCGAKKEFERWLFGGKEDIEVHPQTFHIMRKIIKNYRVGVMYGNLTVKNFIPDCDIVIHKNKLLYIHSETNELTELIDVKFFGEIKVKNIQKQLDELDDDRVVSLQKNGLVGKNKAKIYNILYKYRNLYIWLNQLIVNHEKNKIVKSVKIDIDYPDHGSMKVYLYCENDMYTVDLDIYNLNQEIYFITLQFIVDHFKQNISNDEVYEFIAKCGLLNKMIRFDKLCSLVNKQRNVEFLSTRKNSTMQEYLVFLNDKINSVTNVLFFGFNERVEEAKCDFAKIFSGSNKIKLQSLDDLNEMLGFHLGFGVTANSFLKTMKELSDGTVNSKIEDVYREDEFLFNENFYIKKQVKQWISFLNNNHEYLYIKKIKGKENSELIEFIIKNLYEVTYDIYKYIKNNDYDELVDILRNLIVENSINSVARLDERDIRNKIILQVLSNNCFRQMSNLFISFVKFNNFQIFFEKKNNKKINLSVASYNKRYKDGFREVKGLRNCYDPISFSEFRKITKNTHTNNVVYFSNYKIKSILDCEHGTSILDECENIIRSIDELIENNVDSFTIRDLYLLSVMKSRIVKYFSDSFTFELDFSDIEISAIVFGCINHIFSISSLLVLKLPRFIKVVKNSYLIKEFACSMLKELDISSNLIINHNLLRNIVHLERLYIGRYEKVRLADVEEDAFNHLNNLAILSLTFYRLSMNDRLPIFDLKKIKKLKLNNLSESSLSFTFSEVVKSIRELKSVDVIKLSGFGVNVELGFRKDTDLGLVSYSNDIGMTLRSNTNSATPDKESFQKKLGLLGSRALYAI